jgi:CRISPR-associated protein Cmr5
MTDKPKPQRPVSRPIGTATTSLPQMARSPKPAAPDATTNPRDLDRSRAKDAWEKIQSVKDQGYRAEYGSLARKMPTYIQVNGLAQTLAFLKAKGKEHHTQMFQHLSDWVCSHLKSGTGNLFDRILIMESQRYRLATSEALAYLQWLKRFAEAHELGSKEN